MSITGEKNGPPIRVGVSIGDIIGSLYLCIGILAALKERESSNQGQMIDISLLDCQVSILENAFTRYFATGELPQRSGRSHPLLEPFGAYPTKDGYIAIAVMGPIEQWALFLEIIGRLDLLSDERFHDPDNRYKYRDELEPILNKALKKKTTREWIQEFESFQMPCGPVNNIARVTEDPQLIQRQMFVDLPCTSAKEASLRTPNSPIKFSRTPVKLGMGAPQLGEHTLEILSTLLAMRKEEIEDLNQHHIIGISRNK
jgi:CoA:oxalate CoA-transferase